MPDFLFKELKKYLPNLLNQTVYVSVKNPDKLVSEIKKRIN